MRVSQPNPCWASQSVLHGPRRGYSEWHGKIKPKKSNRAASARGYTEIGTALYLAVDTELLTDAGGSNQQYGAMSGLLGRFGCCPASARSSYSA